MLLQRLEQKELIDPPRWLVSNTHYLAVMGSMAYGVSSNNSDLDLYGVCIPLRHMVFPHETGWIEGFGQRPDKFDVWQKHHVFDQQANGGKGVSYDFQIFNIVKFFQLAMENNPNVIDSLFVRRESILHITETFELVRQNRKYFLHKGIAHKLRGYSYSQLNKAKNCTEYVKKIREYEDAYGIPHSTTHNDTSSIDFMEKYSWNVRSRYSELWSEGMTKTSRFESQKIHNTDLKSLYHVYRLASQAEYILNYHDLDLQEQGRKEKMKAIRRGDVSFEEIQREFTEQEERINRLYETSSLRKFPDEKFIKQLLLTCLESHYGSIDKAYAQSTNGKYVDAIGEINQVLNKYGL